MKTFRIVCRPILLIGLAVCIGSAFGANGTAGEAESPVGLWTTFDDKTGAPRGVVRIFEQNGKLFGRLEKALDPDAKSAVCSACTDERKNRPIDGLLIIRDMSWTGDDYAGGDILDPESGTVYRCSMRIEGQGDRLIVRGYVGISLLGRSQTWRRRS